MTHMTTKRTLAGIATLAALGLAALPASAQTLNGFSGFAPPNGTLVGVAGTVATVSPDNLTLQLTNGTADSVGTIWSSSKQNIGAWTTSFDYQAVKGATATYPADGFTFAMQEEGTTALGGWGGELGYASNVNNGPGVISNPSAAVQFNIYPNGHVNSTGLGTNGFLTDATYPFPTNLLSSGDLVHINLAYNNATNWLSETLTDSTAAVTYTQNIYANLAPLFSGYGGQAYVGFTGASGGQNATQTITNFTFTGNTSAVGATPAPIAVTGFNMQGIQSTPGQQVTPLDAANQWGFFTVNDTSNPANEPLAGGLPANGTIISTGLGAGATFQLAPYTGNDALMLSLNPTVATVDVNASPNSYSFSPSGTLTLQTPGKYSTIGVLAAASYGPGTFNITLNYSDGTTSVSSLTVKDWHNLTVAGAASIDLGPLGTNVGAPLTGAQLYEDYFAADPTKTLDSIDFLDTAVHSNRTISSILAINGVAAPEPGALAALALGGLGLLGLIAKRRKAHA